MYFISFVIFLLCVVCLASGAVAEHDWHRAPRSSEIAHVDQLCLEPTRQVSYFRKSLSLMLKIASGPPGALGKGLGQS